MTIKLSRIAALALLLLLVALPCVAQVSAEEAAKLKTTLTPLGAERAGNKEGTIPAWTGKNVPATPSIRKGWYPNELFPDEKPLFSITAKNVDQYADKLTEGTKAWLKRHPESYRLDVYPTHRTGGIAPEYVYENTFKNATRAKVIGGGLGTTGAIGGIAFPIPKSGIEVYWNMRTRYTGSGSTNQSRAYIVPASGKKIMVGERGGASDYPYYYKGMTEERFKKEYEGFTAQSYVQMINPPADNGTLILTKEPADFTKQERVIYTYLVGQRRTRRAPSFAYDSPNPTNSGYGTNDEATMFYGKPDKWNWKLLGKKEMYIPYNCNKLVSMKDDEVVGAHYPNPNAIRWELHRVWVVELTLQPGKRHVSPRRLIYADEDTWYFVAADVYDAQGKLWKGGLYYTLFDPRVPVTTGAGESWFNLQSGGFLLDGWSSPVSGFEPVTLVDHQLNPNSYYTADALAQRGLR